MTERETVKIYTADDLRQFRDRVNQSQVKERLDAVLMNDIDISEYTSEGTRVSWEPIGNRVARYQGAFYGQGHTIRGLYIDIDIGAKPTQKKHGMIQLCSEYGLFGDIYVGGVKDLTVEGVIENTCTDNFISHVSDVSGIVGTLERGKIYNCINRVDIDLMKRERKYDRQSKSYVTKISANKCWDYPIGGVCGNVIRCPSEIKNCVNQGKLKGLSPHGIVGRSPLQSGSLILRNCRNDGQLSAYAIDSIAAIAENHNQYNQIGGTVIRDLSNKAEGKVIIPFQDSIAGWCCRNYAFNFNTMTIDSKTDTLNGFSKMLAQDANTEAIDENGDTYLHLLCQNDSLSQLMYMDDKNNSNNINLSEVIALLLQYTNIDFRAKNKAGKEAVDLLKYHQYSSRLESTIEMIQEIKKEQAESESDYDDTFSDIGW